MDANVRWPLRERVATWAPYLLLLLPPLFWSGNVVIGRAVRGTIAPVPLTFWRWVVAAAILLPIAANELFRQRNVVRQHWPFLLLLGFLGVFLYQILSYQALTATTALNALLITATAPLSIALVGWLFFREGITYSLAAGIACSLFGVVIVVTQGNVQSLAALQINEGDLLMLSAVLVWAFYSNLLKRRPRDLSQLGLLATTIVTGMVFAAPAFLWDTLQGDRVMWTPAVLLAILYIGLFASVLAYVCWNHGVVQLGANRAGLFINLMPIFGTLLAVLFLGEQPQFYHGVGAALVFGGIVLATGWRPWHGKRNGKPAVYRR
ncbi:MAG: DMT family transporter [Caldilineaceae bacterium]|nr:DMT family transporter [Caldilineaceae bacterium]